MSVQEKTTPLKATLKLPREVIPDQNPDDQHFRTAELADSLDRFVAELSHVVSKLRTKQPGDGQEFDISIVCDFRSTRRMAAMADSFRDAVKLTTDDRSEYKLITFGCYCNGQ